MMQNLDNTKTISSATITCTPINVGESYSSYFTPTKMTLKEFMQKWLNDEIGDGFKFKLDGEEFVADDIDIHTTRKIQRGDYGDGDYEDLFEWIDSCCLTDDTCEIEITQYAARVKMAPVDTNYIPTIYNTNREVRCCPVCGGNGIVSSGFYNHTGNTWVTSTTAPEQCRSCGGKGYVEI